MTRHATKDEGMRHAVGEREQLNRGKPDFKHGRHNTREHWELRKGSISTNSAAAFVQIGPADQSTAAPSSRMSSQRW